MDKLTNLFAIQHRFQKQLGYNFAQLSDERRTDYIKEYTLHCTHELHEMLQELPFFKPWKNYSQLTPIQLRDAYLTACEEYVDALHMFINIGLALGFTGESLYEAYKDKQKINIDRQRHPGYKKCVEIEPITEQGEQIWIE